MPQRTSNLYRLITFPSVYKGLMAALGAEQAKSRLAAELYRVPAGARVLDVGCGPASLFPYFSQADYTGLDLNPHHIAYAVAKYGSRGRFLLGDASHELLAEGGSFDLVIASALLHHLDDDKAKRMLDRLCQLVRPGGRIVTFDNVWLPRQHPVAWALNRLDSGQNVRFEAGYRDLVKGLPVTVEGKLYRDLLRIPYDHFSMTLTRH